MTIRLLTPADETTYRAALVAALDEEPREFFRTRVVDLEAQLLREPAPDDFSLGAFLSSGELVGAASFKREMFSTMRHKALLYRMFVLPLARGSGAGRSLLEAVIERARSATGLEQINLTVLSGNTRAKRLYQSLGFSEFSHETRAVKAENGYHDETQMVLFLSTSHTS